MNPTAGANVAGSQGPVAPSIAVVGLGFMGSAVARAFLRAGLEVTVWNRTAGKSVALEEQGARVARSLADAVAASDLVVSCLLDYPMTEELLTAPRVATAAPGKTFVATSTGSPAEVRSLAYAIRSAGASYLDGKIMCFPEDVGAHDAEFLFSGPRDLFEQQEPTLRILGGASKFVSTEVVAAAVLYNALWTYDFAARFAYIEAAALAEAAGLDLSDLLQSAQLRTNSIGTQLAELTARFKSREYEGEQASIEIYRDSVPPMRDAFAEFGLKSAFLAAVAQLAETGVEAGRGRGDIAAIFQVMLDRRDG